MDKVLELKQYLLALKEPVDTMELASEFDFRPQDVALVCKVLELELVTERKMRDGVRKQRTYVLPKNK